MPDVVVGVDGSEHSLRALRMAAREARCRSSRLHVIYVYEPVSPRETEVAATVVAAGTWPSPEAGGTLLRDAHRHGEERRAEARRHAQSRVRQIVRDAEVDLEGLDVELSAIGDEHPAAALVRLSRGADLLVVGSRGFGGFVGLLLGSVGQQCVHHAACPVLVARPSQ